MKSLLRAMMVLAMSLRAACACEIDVETYERRWRTADYVFEGEVVGVEVHRTPPYPQADFGLTTVRFRVLRVWRGAVTHGTFDLLTDLPDSCSPDYPERQRLIVLGRENEGRRWLMETQPSERWLIEKHALGEPTWSGVDGCASCEDAAVVLPAVLVSAPLRRRRRKVMAARRRRPATPPRALNE